MNIAVRSWTIGSSIVWSWVPLLLVCCIDSQNGDSVDSGTDDSNGASGATHGGGNGGKPSSNGGSGGKHNGNNGGSANGNAGTHNGGTANGGSSDGGNDSGTGGDDSGTGGTGGSGECIPNPVCSPDPPPSTGDVYADCVNRINQFRTQCLCMEPLERWTDAESCADQHAEYDSTRDPHSGFRDDICEPGAFGQNECPGWNSETQVIDGCLQQMWNEGPPPTDPCDGACFQEYGHFINMTNPDFTRVACGFYETPDGEIWAVQNFR